MTKKTGILSGENQDTEFIDPNNFRPLRLSEFVGQSRLKENLSVFVGAAKTRSEVLDHVLFYGPPGLGKTTLANIVSQEMGVGFKSTSGPVLSKAGDLAAILTNISPGDVLFIDEIHRLNIAVEEMLYLAMEDYKIDIIIGEGAGARSIKIDLPKFTLIGATTRFGLLSSPLRGRFGILSHLEFYSSDELTEVVMRAARIINVPISDDAALEIASRARGTPRIALRLLRRVRDFADVSNGGNIDISIAKKSLEQLEVNAIGLDQSDMSYLRFILDNYYTGSVGLDTICAGLSEEKDVIEDTIEPYLLKIGFISRTPRGRQLTKKALSHLGVDCLEEQNNQLL